MKGLEGLDRIELDSTGFDRIGQDWTGFYRVQQDLICFDRFEDNNDNITETGKQHQQQKQSLEGCALQKLRSLKNKENKSLLQV